jgi:hypothetical protein
MDSGGGMKACGETESTEEGKTEGRDGQDR